MPNSGLYFFLNETRLGFFIWLGGFLDFAGLVTKYLDDGFRANNCTHCTACTIAVNHLSREETVFIGFIGDDDAALRACNYAKAAAFASFDIDNNFTSHLVKYE
jgi:hypothetical protein